MNTLRFLAILLVSFAAMEWAAWAAHRYLMHGVLWVLHRDHHKRERGRRLQRNDAFFVMFAVPSWLGIMLGSMNQAPAWVAMGFGIAAYGVAYFLVHEVFIHKRFKFWNETRSVYWSAVRRAHMQHHRHLEREDGECFGLLWVERRYLDEASRKLNRDTP